MNNHHLPRSCVLASALSLGALITVLPSWAGTVQGQINAQLVVNAGCVIDNAIGGTSDANVNFGMLDFGSTPTIWNTPIDQRLSGGRQGSNLQITCSPDADALRVSIDGGTNADGAQRRMAFNGNFIPYEIYRNGFGDTPYPANGLVSLALGAASSATLNIFGRVPANPDIPLAAGTYTDTLNVTIEF